MSSHDSRRSAQALAANKVSTSRVIAITWLFGYPWDPTRGVYNQQQFDGLAKQLDFRVLVAVPWTVVLRNFKAFRAARRATSQRSYPVNYFISFHLPGIGRSLSGALYLASLVVQQGFSIVRARPTCLLGSWGYPDGAASSALGWLLRVPVVLKVHGSDVNVYTQSRSRRWQIRLACNYAYRVCCVSKALGERLVEIGVDRQRIQVNYNGVDQTKFTTNDRARARTELRLAPDAPIILFVGNVLDSKGAADLLAAFVLLRQRRPDAQLVYVGDGADRARLEREVSALQISAYVRFTGKIAHAELGVWYAAADLLCLPSHAEGVPNVILEAMSCGQPVVASNVGGIPEVLPDFAGMTVAAHDPAALCNALATGLAKSWDREQITAHARQFTWERNVAIMADTLANARLPVAARAI